MIKHSASHGCATLVCTVIAGIIVALSHRYLPALLDLMSPLAMPVVAVLGVVPFFTEENVKVIILAAVLALLWGVAFKRRFV